MKTAVVTSATAPWEIQEGEMPEPALDQVLIKIHASGLCYTDVHQAMGHFGMPYPMRLGHEPVGEIVKVGAAVHSRKVGDRVGVPWVQSWCGRCEWCERGLTENCERAVATAIGIPGGHTEFMLAFAKGTMLIPDGLSYEQAAPMFCAGYTVFSGLKIAAPQPNERLAVIGIGGLGHLAVQFSKAAGLHTTGVTHSPDKVALLEELGADNVVASAKELARSGGVDIVLATSNSNEAMNEALSVLRPNGRLVLMGVDGSKPFQFLPMEHLTKRIRIITSSQNGREDLYEALAIAASGKVKVMAETFALVDIAQAYKRVSEGTVRFRAVIVPHG